MFGDDALKHAWGAGAVPHALGVDDGDRTLLAHAKTICFGAIDTSVLGEIEFGETLLQIFP